MAKYLGVITKPPTDKVFSISSLLYLFKVDFFPFKYSVIGWMAGSVSVMVRLEERLQIST